MANIVEIIIKGTDKTGKLFKDTEKSTKDLQTNLRKIAAVGGSVVAAGYTLKKVFDLGEEGAVIAQTHESFSMLLEKVSAAPNLLDQLTAASRGTISQMDLMTSTSTLLAGTQGELATRLAESTPRLMEIAKAANKLNPALGDTAFMYQSIATGVKRAQPLILDNLGLTLKVGEANENYAKSIGKTVEQLTAEERAMAILDATLKAGDVMINQVGGTTESLADRFKALTVNLKDFHDEFATRVAMEMPEVLDILNEYLENQNMIAAAEREYGIQKKLFLDDFVYEGKVIAKNVDELREWVKAQEEAKNAQTAAIQKSGELIGTYHNLSIELREQEKAAKAVAEANREIVLSMSEITQAELAKEVMEELNMAYQEGQIDVGEYKSLFEITADTIGGVDRDTIRAQLALFDLRQEVHRQQPELQELIRLYRQLGQEIGAIPSTIPSAPKKKQVFYEDIYPRYQSGGTMVVPPGYNRDDFIIGVSSGERVDITPKGKVAGEGSQNIFNIYPSSSLDVEEMIERIAQRIAEY